MAFENDLRMEERVNAMRSSSLNMAGVTKDFEDNFNKINGYLASKLAKSTDGKYLSSFKKFEQFCTENNVLSLPSHPEVIMTYFIKISEKSIDASKSKRSIGCKASSAQTLGCLHMSKKLL